MLFRSIPVLLAFVSGCGGTVSNLPQHDPILGLSSPVREEFDPQTLDDDDFLLKPTAGGRIFEIPEPVLGRLPSNRRIRPQGYRVQIAAVLDQRGRAGGGEPPGPTPPCGEVSVVSVAGARHSLTTH